MRKQRPTCPGEPHSVRFDVPLLNLRAFYLPVLHQVRQGSKFAGSVATGHDRSVAVYGHI